MSSGTPVKYVEFVWIIYNLLTIFKYPSFLVRCCRAVITLK